MDVEHDGIWTPVIRSSRKLEPSKVHAGASRHFPECEIVWGLRDYGVHGIWVKRASTVLSLPRENARTLACGRVVWDLILRRGGISRALGPTRGNTTRCCFYYWTWL